MSSRPSTGGHQALLYHGRMAGTLGTVSVAVAVEVEVGVGVEVEITAAGAIAASASWVGESTEAIVGAEATGVAAGVPSAKRAGWGCAVATLGPEPQKSARRRAALRIRPEALPELVLAGMVVTSGGEGAVAGLSYADWKL